MLALALSLPAVGLLLHPQLAPRCAGDGMGARAALRCSAEVTYGGIAHAGVIVSSTEVAFQFYTQVLGMEDETHIRSKKLPFPGAFVRAGEQQIHIMELPNPDPVDGRPEHGGARLSTPHRLRTLARPGGFAHAHRSLRAQGATGTLLWPLRTSRRLSSASSRITSRSR